MDDLESRLSATLVEQAERVDIPRCDPRALVLAGREHVHRRRSATLRVAAAGAAAVALLAAGVGLASRWTEAGSTGPGHDVVGTKTGPTSTGRPLTLGDLPRGEPLRLPYWLRGRLHLGGRTVPMPQPSIVSAGGTTLVVVHPGTKDMSIALVVGKRLETLQYATGWPVLSADGRLAAWETRSGSDLARLVLWDTATGRQVASRDFVSHAQCCDAPSQPVGIDSQGRVYVWDRGRAIVWDHVSQTVRQIEGMPKHGSGMYGASSRGPVYARSLQSDSRLGTSVYGSVDDSGVFHSVGTIPTQSPAWSPDGAHVAFVDDSGAVTVLDVSTRRTANLRLPAISYSVLGWDGDDQVVVVGSYDPATYLVRCDIGTGRCETAAALPYDLTMVLPDFP